MAQKKIEKGDLMEDFIVNSALIIMQGIVAAIIIAIISNYKRIKKQYKLLDKINLKKIFTIFIILLNIIIISIFIKLFA